MKNVGLSWTGVIMLEVANNIGACFVCFFQYSWQYMLVVQRLYTAPSEKNEDTQDF